jgi:hypothetical protein
MPTSVHRLASPLSRSMGSVIGMRIVGAEAPMLQAEYAPGPPIVVGSMATACAPVALRFRAPAKS